MAYLQRWLRQPQTVWLRKATFQLHLWSGIALGLYVLMVSVTGSVLVYRNELYRAATRDPVVVAGTGPLLSDEQLKAAARRAYPGYTILNVGRGRTAGQTVAISLHDGGKRKNRLFNPYTGADLGDAVPLGIKAVSQLIALHDDLLGGPTGREINGLAALLLVGLTVTGIVVWWPGVRTLAAKPDASEECRLATLDLGSPQRARVLDLRRHPAVRGKRRLSRPPREVSGCARPDRAPHRRQRADTHG